MANLKEDKIMLVSNPCPEEETNTGIVIGGFKIQCSCGMFRKFVFTKEYYEIYKCTYCGLPELSNR
jgi:hypothetical protein